MLDRLAAIFIALRLSLSRRRLACGAYGRGGRVPRRCIRRNGARMTSGILSTSEAKPTGAGHEY